MSEIGNIGGIRIKGRNFETEQYLPILTVQKKDKATNEMRNCATRVSIIYGENGSGKTTISKAFLKIKGASEDIVLANILDSEQNIVDIRDDLKNIFVFNEEYIDNNLKIKQDGLNTIVILGSQNDVDRQIEKINNEDLNPVNDKISSLYDEKMKYEDSSSKDAPEYYLLQMKSKLKGDENWAGRQRIIKGNKRNESVNDIKYKDFINLSPKMSRDKLIGKFHDLEKELDKLQSDKSYSKLPLLNLNKYISGLKQNMDNLNKLLQQQIPNTRLSEFDKELVQMIKSSSKVNLTETQKILCDSEVNYCPTCLQKIDDIYRKETLKFIEQFLNRNVEKYKVELRNSLMIKVDVDFVVFSGIEGLREIQEAKSSLDNMIDATNQKIQVKIDNPYTSLIINNDILKVLYRFEKCIDYLNDNITKYNENIPDKQSIIEEMSYVNNEIAYYDIINDYKLMNEARIKKDNVNQRYSKLVNEKTKIEGKIAELEEQKKNIKIALDAINFGLEYIFFSKNRLHLEYQNNKYILYTHDKPVTPDNVSVGERNIIALCYFFVSILMDKSEDAYKDPYLIVIDDPISSFDMENRIGIMSYLKYKLSEFLNSNQKTQVVILTHDLQVLFDSEKMINEILGKGILNCKSYQLRKRKLINCNKSSRNGYSRLMNEVYDYANDEDIDDTTIGNEMRKLLESFSTFNYRQSIEKVSIDEDILSKLNERDRLYYKNLMYRLVLHGESHTEERIDTLDDINFSDFISEEEKRRTARDIICFLNALDPIHVLKHLTKQGKKENEIKQNLQSWRDHK